MRERFESARCRMSFDGGLTYISMQGATVSFEIQEVFGVVCFSASVSFEENDVGESLWPGRLLKANHRAVRIMVEHEAWTREKRGVSSFSVRILNWRDDITFIGVTMSGVLEYSLSAAERAALHADDPPAPPARPLKEV